MEWIYDSIVKKHGEGEEALAAYRKWAALCYFLAGAIIDVALYFIGKYTNRNMMVVYFVMGVLAVYFIYKIIYVLRSALNSLHPMPESKKLDAHGGRLELKEPHGEKMLELKLPNDASVKANYVNHRYVCTVCNDEWDEVASFVGMDLEEFYDAYEKAASYAASLVKLPEGEYDDTDHSPAAPTDDDSQPEVYYDTGEEDEDDEDEEDEDEDDNNDDDDDDDGEDDSE